MAHRPFTYNASLDFYKILKVSQTASLSEIKQSYRQLALELHPDRHDGCVEKLAAFKRLNEAYTVLSDVTQRRQYDTSLLGVRHSRTMPYNYRKVYAPAPPPEWKTVWDHRVHFDMHYGTGFQKEAMRQMRESAKREGDFEYQSPLGKGFAFSHESSENVNPFSKRPQGPPKIIWDYEEVEVDMDRGVERMTRRERIVHDLASRKQERQQKQHRSSVPNHNKQQQSRFQATCAKQQPAASNNDCVIL